MVRASAFATEEGAAPTVVDTPDRCCGKAAGANPTRSYKRCRWASCSCCPGNISLTVCAGTVLLDLCCCKPVAAAFLEEPRAAGRTVLVWTAGGADPWRPPEAESGIPLGRYSPACWIAMGPTIGRDVEGLTPDTRAVPPAKGLKVMMYLPYPWSTCSTISYFSCLC